MPPSQIRGVPPITVSNADSLAGSICGEAGNARTTILKNNETSSGSRDVVALSVGARDGVDNGTVFSVWRVGSTVVDKVAVGAERTEDTVGRANQVRLPDEFAGHVMVFRTFDKVSYGLIMDTIKPVRVGYELKHPDAAY